MDIRKQFGMRVRYLRKIRKLSIEDLSLEAKVNRNYLGDLERGKRNPTLKVIGKIAEALDVDLSYLFKGLTVNDNFTLII